MPGLSLTALARRAGVSQPGVSAAVKRGVLRRGHDGLIDTEIEPNRSWLALHAHGVDCRGRDMRTYARPNGATEQAKAQTPAMSDAELSELVSRSLAELEQHRMTDADLDELSQRVADWLDQASRSSLDQRFLTLLEELRTEQREAFQRLSARLDEVNLQLRMMRGPMARANDCGAAPGAVGGGAAKPPSN